MQIIGLMSGTSADGIDAALVDFEGEGRETRFSLRGFVCVPFCPELRTEILWAASGRSLNMQKVCLLNAALGEAFAAAAADVARRANIDLRTVEAIACHGQTVWHQPAPARAGGIEARGTLQLGSPSIIAARTGCRVVSDFRAADMAAGGQGAPLVPYADWALIANGLETCAVQNIGGIANVTYLPPGGSIDDVIAFDTGPGNMVIDAVVNALSEGRLQYDKNGEWASRGQVNSTLLHRLLSHPFFAQGPPKSTGREQFGSRYTANALRAARRLSVRDEDTVATVTMLTAQSIADAYGAWLLPRGNMDAVIVGGGGTSNATLMRMLLELLPSQCRMATHAELGIPDDAKEAMAFALLGYETLHGRTSNVPSATGATRRVILGSITPTPTG